MKLDEANLLLVKYEGGDLYLTSSTFFTQEHFVPFGEPEIGEKDEQGKLPITLKVVEGPQPNATVSTEDILQPATHIVNLGSMFEIVQNNGHQEINGEIEVTVLMGKTDDSNTFIGDSRSVKPTKTKVITSGGESRPVGKN